VKEEEEKEEEEEEEEIIQQFIRIHVQTAALVLVSVKSSNTAWLLHPQSLHLHLNNKLKAVKFRHSDYQCNCIIELRTEPASCKMCSPNAAADIRTRVPQSTRRLRMPGLKISVQYYKLALSPKIGQFEVIFSEKCLKISSINNDNDNGSTTNNYHLPEQRTDFLWVLGGCD